MKKKKPEWTIEKVIEALESNTCYECSYGCSDGPISCEAECVYKDAMIKAVEYLKILLALNDQIAQIPKG